MEDIEGIVRTALFIKLKMFRQEEINLLWTWITQSSILALDKTDFFILMNFMEGLEQALRQQCKQPENRSNRTAYPMQLVPATQAL